MALLLSMPPLAWTAALLAGTPPLIIAAAVAPALVFAVVVLFAQRGSGRPLSVLAASLLWGAIGAAFLSSTGNNLARHWIDTMAGDDSRQITATLVAPALEEAAKAFGLLLIFRSAPRGLRDARDGIVYGALIGIGFVCTENLLYLGVSVLQGGEAGLLRALYLRGALGGATHLVFTACAGAGLGWWALRGGRESAWPRLLPWLGFLFAWLQHVAWNALAAPAIGRALCGAQTANGVCLAVPTHAAVFGEASVIALVFLAPGIAFLALAARQPRRSS